MEIYRLFFGQRLREALARAALNQSRFAEMLNVETSTVSRWVNGRDFADDSRLNQICTILNVNKDYFVPKAYKPGPAEALEVISSIVKEYQKIKSF